MRLLLAMVLLCFYSANCAAQHTEKDYARNPVWMVMIDDTTSNYFEVEKAYDIYWQHHEMPEGEHDVIGERREREKIPSKRKQRKIEKENAMRVAIKKYQRWHERMLPFVQEDGRILTPSERIAIWKSQQK